MNGSAPHTPNSVLLRPRDGWLLRQALEAAPWTRRARLVECLRGARELTPRERGAALPDLPAARLELLRLGVRELARLLRLAAAARHRDGRRAAGRAGLGLPEPPPLAAVATLLGEELLALARTRGRGEHGARATPQPFADLARRLGGSGSPPTTLELAAAAAALQDGLHARLWLAAGLAESGERAAAESAAAPLLGQRFRGGSLERAVRLCLAGAPA